MKQHPTSRANHVLKIWPTRKVQSRTTRSMRLYRCNGGTTAYRPRSLGITCRDWSRCSSQHHSPSDWIGGGTSTSIVVAQERAPCAAAMEGGLRPGLRPPVSELREWGGAVELRTPTLGSYAPPRSAVARYTRPTHAERRRQGGHPGPIDDGSGTRGGGSGDWPPEAHECGGRQVRPHDLGADGQGKRGKKGVEEGDRRSARPSVACSPQIRASPA